MKEIVEEYGMVVIAIIAISVIVGVILRLRQIYWIAQLMFLGGIGG